MPPEPTGRTTLKLKSTGSSISPSHYFSKSRVRVTSTAAILQTSPVFRADQVPVVYESTPEKFHPASTGPVRNDRSLQNSGPKHSPQRSAHSHWLDHSRLRPLRSLTLPTLLLSANAILYSQVHPIGTSIPYPDAPLPVIKHQNSKNGPCRVIPKIESAGMAMTETGSAFIATVAEFPPAEVPPQPAATEKPDETTPPQELPACQPMPLVDFYQRFMNGPEVKPLTPKEKGFLAIRNILDPFNAITILGNAAVTIGYDSHTPYGPGLRGFSKLVGVSYSEDMTGEFVGTFLIPSIVHQDPHYHRMPRASFKRRILHAIVQVGWTQGDNGKGMPNYANIFGFPIDAEIANLYAPGLQTDLRATAARVGSGWALAPTDNFITEFLPDLASHIHVRVVLVQQIISQIARTEPMGTQ